MPAIDEYALVRAIEWARWESGERDRMERHRQAAARRGKRVQAANAAADLRLCLSGVCECGHLRGYHRRSYSLAALGVPGEACWRSPCPCNNYRRKGSRLPP